MKSRFKVYGSLDRAGRNVSGTVIIDREAETFSVRPKRSRKLYTTNLSVVADIVVERIIKAELREKAREKKARKHEKNRNS